MATEKMNRRQWLRRGLFWGTAGAAFSVLGGMLVDVWLAAGRFSPAHWAEVAPYGAIPAGGIVPFYDKKVALVLREGRMAALSLECTHLGCLVNAGEEGFFCPCHGSRFGPMGEVYSGPARRSLQWHALEIRRNRIWVYTGRKMDHPEWLAPAAEAGLRQGASHGG